MLAAVTEIDWPNAVYLSVLLLVVAASYIVGNSSRLKDFRAFAVWSGIIATLVLIYSFRDDGLLLWQRFAASTVPGYFMESDGELVLMRSQNGMFEVKAKVNGTSVTFMFDTGASAVALTAKDAENAGIRLLESDYTSRVQTANGEARAAEVTLDTLQIGNLTEQNVKALVAKPGAMDQSLLGHSFLDRLSSYEVKGDKLTLRYR